MIMLSSNAMYEHAKLEVDSQRAAFWSSLLPQIYKAKQSCAILTIV